MKITGLYVLCTALALSFFACSNPSGTSSSDDLEYDESQLRAPSSVSASFSDNTIRVVWSEVSAAEEYKVYRKEDVGSFQFVKSTSSLVFGDSAYSRGSTVQYAVTSVSEGMESPLSTASNSLSEWVRDIEVSTMEHSNKISLSWSGQDEADEYIVYRAPSKTSGSVEIARFSSGDKLVGYDDSSADIAVDTPYYYQVRWKKGEVEYGSTSPLYLGLFSTTVDLGEPENDDIKTLSGDSYVEIPSQPPILYSIGDKVGGVESDVDWYKYEARKGDAVTVTVKKPAVFDDGELFIQFSYDNALSTPVAISGSVHEEIYSIPSEGSPGENASLFFKIYPVTGTAETLIGSYSVSIGNSL